MEKPPQTYAHHSQDPDKVTLLWLATQRTWYPTKDKTPAAGWNHPRERSGGKSLVDQMGFKVTSQSTNDVLLDLPETHAAIQQMAEGGSVSGYHTGLLLNRFHAIQVLDFDIPPFMHGHRESYQAMNAMISRLQALGDNVLVFESLSGNGLQCMFGRSASDWREGIDEDAPKTMLPELGEDVKLERWLNQRMFVVTGKLVSGDPLAPISQVSRTVIDTEFPVEQKMTIDMLPLLYNRDALGRARRLVAHSASLDERQKFIHTLQGSLWYCEPETGIRRNLDSVEPSTLHALSLASDTYHADQLRENVDEEIGNQWHEAERKNNSVPNSRHIRQALYTVLHEDDVLEEVKTLSVFETRIANSELYSQPQDDFWVHIKGSENDYVLSCSSERPVEREQLLAGMFAESTVPIPGVATGPILEYVKKNHPLECELVDAVLDSWGDKWKVVAWAAMRPRKALLAVVGRGDRGKSMLFGMLKNAGLAFVLDNPKELTARDKTKFPIIDNEITKNRIVMIDEASSALHIKDDEPDPAAIIFASDALKTLTSGMDRSFEDKWIARRTLPVVGTPVFVANDRLGFPTENREVLMRSIFMSAPTYHSSLANRAVGWYERTPARIYFLTLFVEEMLQHWNEYSILHPPLTDEMWMEHIHLAIDCAKYSALNTQKKWEDGEIEKRLAQAEGRCATLLSEDPRIPTSVKETVSIADDLQTIPPAPVVDDNVPDPFDMADVDIEDFF